MTKGYEPIEPKGTHEPNEVSTWRLPHSPRSRARRARRPTAHGATAFPFHGWHVPSAANITIPAAAARLPSTVRQKVVVIHI
jgi:hypothetical protein